MAGLTASVSLQHYFFRNLTPWLYRGMSVAAGTIGVACCAYYLTRKLDRLFSAHLQVTQKLAFERNLLRTVMDNIPDGVMVKDCEGKYLLWNKAFTKLHRLKSSESLLGKTAFDLFPEGPAAAFHAIDLEVMKAVKPVTKANGPKWTPLEIRIGFK